MGDKNGLSALGGLVRGGARASQSQRLEHTFPSGRFLVVDTIAPGRNQVALRNPLFPGRFTPLPKGTDCQIDGVRVQVSGGTVSLNGGQTFPPVAPWAPPDPSTRVGPWAPPDPSTRVGPWAPPDPATRVSGYAPPPQGPRPLNGAPGGQLADDRPATPYAPPFRWK